MSACDPCLRRAGLVAALAGHLEIAWRQRRGALRDVLSLSDDELTLGLSGEEADAFLAGAPHAAPGRLRECADAAHVALTCRCDPVYPASLAELRDAPAVLFSRGDLGLLDGEAAASVVGTRRPSPEGRAAAEGLGRGIAAAGVTVVSGMAMGVDAAAHKGALAAGGPTIAVLASGPDVAYPACERDTYRRLCTDALVVSEAPPGARPHRWAFPARNRIIAALGRVTIVVEGAERSGSLITAEFAAQMGRDVAAVPGRAGSPTTRGSNLLLRDGAAVVLDSEDALDLLLGTDRTPVGGGTVLDGLAPPLRLLLADVRRGHLTVPALVRAGHDPDAVLIGVSELELRGLVRRGAGGVVTAVV